MSWEVVIGIEVHVQLATQSKIFSGSSTTFGAEPNTQASIIDLGLPGVLPVLNQKAVEHAVRFGLAIDAKIGKTSVFARKNYFYPDLPKGYQISQADQPTVGKGHLDITLSDGSKKRIGITRAHLEEDAGKSVHGAATKQTGIDLNRAGTPLLEIVSEPDMRSKEEAIAYLKTLHGLVRFLGISDGNMQEGSFRADINVSIRPTGTTEFGTRTETKNVNSFKFIEKAIDYEVARQIDVLESGGEIIQETRLYDPDKDMTKSMRSKENAHDYRYFPEPDLLPVVLSDDYIADIADSLPELPWQMAARLQKELGLSDYDASVLTSSKEMADYFEQTLSHCQQATAKMVANWVIGELTALLNKHNIELSACPVQPHRLAGVLERLADKTISHSAGKKVLEALWESTDDADGIIEQQGLKQMSDTSAISSIIDDIIANNPSQVADYRSGKTKLMAFFVGQAMKATKGKADPGVVNQLLQEKL